MYAFTGRILIVDLSTRASEVIENDEAFYRKYIGGSLLAARLLEDYLPASGTVHALSPDNPLVFATGPMAGAKVCGVTRVNVLTVSPETPGIYLSQAGGEFGPDLKRAGFDALVVRGQASAPVTLRIAIADGQTTCELHDAAALWGVDRQETDARLRQELGKGYTMACIGPAGENRVPCANIMFEPDHYAGRGGMGAVMGAKNLKAICVGGKGQANFGDPKGVKKLNKAGAAFFRALSEDSFCKGLANLGTFSLLAGNNAGGNLPTRNFGEAHIADADFAQEVSHENVGQAYVGKNNPCKACFMTCKKKDGADPDRTALAEYESIALLGPNLGLNGKLELGLQACELCNLLGLDSISTGNMIGWLMDCFEDGVLDEAELGGAIRFGDHAGVMALIEDIALARGPFGALLANGVEAAAAKLGDKTRDYLRFAKGVGIPAHLPRKKPGIGFGYLHGPNPGDHMKLEHDWIAADETSLANFGIPDAISASGDLDDNKVLVARTTQIYYSMVDTLSLCLFIFGPGNTYSFAQITDMAQAATGMDFSFAELMTAGERSIQLQRKLHMRLGGQDEDLLPFMTRPIPAGPSRGMKIDPDDFASARKHYYQLWSWDEAGNPTDAILRQLGV